MKPKKQKKVIVKEKATAPSLKTSGMKPNSKDHSPVENVHLASINCDIRTRSQIKFMNTVVGKDPIAQEIKMTVSFEVADRDKLLNSINTDKDIPAKVIKKSKEKMIKEEQDDKDFKISKLIKSVDTASTSKTLEGRPSTRYALRSIRPEPSPSRSYQDPTSHIYTTAATDTSLICENTDKDVPAKVKTRKTKKSKEKMIKEEQDDKDFKISKLIKSVDTASTSKTLEGRPSTRYALRSIRPEPSPSRSYQDPTSHIYTTAATDTSLICENTDKDVPAKVKTRKTKKSKEKMIKEEQDDKDFKISKLIKSVDTASTSKTLEGRPSTRYALRSVRPEPSPSRCYQDPTSHIYTTAATDTSLICENTDKDVPAKVKTRKTKKSKEKMIKEQQDDKDFKISKLIKSVDTASTSKTLEGRPSTRYALRSVRPEPSPSRSYQNATFNIYTTEFGTLRDTPLGREAEIDLILLFLREKLIMKTNGWMYIYGDLGTGKTSTVYTALRVLKEFDDVPQFQFVEINGITIAQQQTLAYIEIYKQLSGRSVDNIQAFALLAQMFTKKEKEKKELKRIPTVIFVDELDTMCARKADLLHALAAWACSDTSLLTVLTIAHIKDPDKSLPACITLRQELTYLKFLPYTRDQLKNIVALFAAKKPMSTSTINFIVRKSATTGGAKRALAVCTRALELSSKSESLGMSEAYKAWMETADKRRKEKKKDVKLSRVMSKAKAASARQTRRVSARLAAIKGLLARRTADAADSDIISE